jgi:hypothetical protein
VSKCRYTFIRQRGATTRNTVAVLFTAVITSAVTHVLLVRHVARVIPIPRDPTLPDLLQTCSSSPHTITHNCLFMSCLTTLPISQLTYRRYLPGETEENHSTCQGCLCPGTSHTHFRVTQLPSSGNNSIHFPSYSPLCLEQCIFRGFCLLVWLISSSNLKMDVLYASETSVD